MKKQGLATGDTVINYSVADIIRTGRIETIAGTYQIQGAGHEVPHTSDRQEYTRDLA